MPQLFRALFLFTALFAAPRILLLADDVPATKGTILFYGDSLTAGYGIDPAQAYPALIQEKIDSAGLPWQVVVGAVSGDTSAGGLSRLGWMLRRPVDIFVLALGANDGLRGVDLTETEKNLQAIIDKVREKNPDVTVVIVGMLLPPNLGEDYTQRFAIMYPRLAKTNDAVLIPFLLKGVGGVPSLNLPDRIHPNPEGQIIVADNVWEYLEPLLLKAKPTD